MRIKIFVYNYLYSKNLFWNISGPVLITKIRRDILYIYMHIDVNNY